MPPSSSSSPPPPPPPPPVLPTGHFYAIFGKNGIFNHGAFSFVNKNAIKQGKSGPFLCVGHNFSRSPYVVKSTFGAFFKPKTGHFFVLRGWQPCPPLRCVPVMRTPNRPRTPPPSLPTRASQNKNSTIVKRRASSCCTDSVIHPVS